MMEGAGPIACVTGASGMVGGSIAGKLLSKGYRVRVMSRDRSFLIPGAQSFVGGLEDDHALSQFLEGSRHLFHCAAELRDESSMWKVNVGGTEKLLKMTRSSGLRYLCYISSVGVTGLADGPVVDERTRCDPQSMYERSKLAAEQLVMEGIDGCNVVVLRPTNVIDGRNPGALLLPIRGTWRDRLAVFVKGGENAHIVHADDVADAAVHFIDGGFRKAECYIVSCDDDPGNTFAGLWRLYRKHSHPDVSGRGPQVLHLPISVPYVVRSLRRGRVNRGDIRYCSDKLLATGFTFSLGVEGAVGSIAASTLRGS